MPNYKYSDFAFQEPEKINPCFKGRCFNTVYLRREWIWHETGVSAVSVLTGEIFYVTRIKIKKIDDIYGKYKVSILQPKYKNEFPDWDVDSEYIPKTPQDPVRDCKRSYPDFKDDKER